MLCAKQMNRKHSNTGEGGRRKKITNIIKHTHTKKKPLWKHCFNSFRLENKFLKAEFPASPCCSPQNVHAAEDWEEYLAE